MQKIFKTFFADFKDMLVILAFPAFCFSPGTVRVIKPKNFFLKITKNWVISGITCIKILQFPTSGPKLMNSSANYSKFYRKS